MSEVPKGLQRAAGLRWALVVSAVLLTVVAGVLGFFEVASSGSSAPRSFVMSIAMVVWSAWIALSCALWIIKRITKCISRAKNEIIAAIVEKRLGNVADLMEDNIRWINEKR